MGIIRDSSCKLCRRSRTKLFLKGSRCLSAKCAIEKRNVPPGPQPVMPKKMSEFGMRLREKQKLRFFYGVSERQIRKYYSTALQKKGITGHNLLSIFERRFDNVVFRCSLAKSRREARQIIRHGALTINEKKVDMPSYILRPGDKIVLRKKADGEGKQVDSASTSLPSWIRFDQKQSMITVLQEPQRTEIDAPVDEQLIVEYYSK